MKFLQRSPLSGGAPSAAVILMAALIIVSALSRPASAERRISVGVFPTFYWMDEDYFGMDSALGVDISLRYEIFASVFFENRLGVFTSSQDGNSVTGLNGQIGVTSVLPFLIPWRPSVRIAAALVSADPVISEPVTSFRPSQTVLFLVGGVGLTRILRGPLQVEAGLDLLVSPYRYRIYDFHRQYVDTNEARFTHLVFSLGIIYSF